MQKVQTQIRLLSGSTLFSIPFNILSRELHKKQILAKTVWNEMFEILGHLPYYYV